MPSDIQVFVKWKDQTIFAGEDVECTITFKNVAETNVEPHPGGPTSHYRQPSRATSTHSESLFSLKSPQKFFFSPHRRSYSTAAKKSPSHRLSSSVSSPLIGSHSFPPPSTPRNGSAASGKHKRSVSILSIDSEGTGEPTPRTSSQFSHPRPLRRHGRAASLQVLPRRYEAYEDQSAIGGRSPVRSFPPTESSIQSSPGNPRIDIDGPNDTSRPGSNIYSPNRSVEPPRTPARRPPLSPIDFKFPPSPAADPNSHIGVSTLTSPIEENPLAPRSNGKEMTALAAPGHLPQLTRIMSTSSLAGSHRSSGDYNSISDNSSETLQSEYTNYSMTVPRPPIVSRHSRHVSSVESPGLSPHSQTLLMGYAQISASFTVDGSLIHQSIFEEVKRKGVVGGAGGAVGQPSGKPAASEDKSRKSGGFWGAFKWNAIEESLSGLLSNNELDGLRDMRGVSSSRSIPLLSTTQSLLFVDLRLAPGEEQSYSFSFTLPSGLPASHKGKAIKISYNLVIGTQRPSSRNEPQRVNRISIPFRVFSGVNGQGDIMGHDLMSPYVLLRDEARVQRVGTNPAPPVVKPKSISGPTWTSAPEFLSYVDDILEKASRNNSLHPPEASAEHRASHESATGRLSCKDAIDLAILRSNQALHSSRSPNRFEIARNGRRIAVVVLNRPSHRLGETIIATVNFTDAALPCYALRATLESSERVAPALAIRSNASIRRATRKVHASYFENTLYATRVVFSPAIPVSATPTILTTGVNHEWELRFEFVTSNAHDGSAPSGSRLLEAVSEDERGRVMSALETIGCESFEIAIPITIYGETVRERLPEENEGYAI